MHEDETRRPEATRCSFTAAGPRLWNSLPGPLRQAKTLATFKSQLKTFFSVLIRLRHRVTPDFRQIHPCFGLLTINSLCCGMAGIAYM